MEFESMLSERGKLLLIYKGFKFRKHRELKKSGETVWCCANKKCSVQLYTLNSVFSKISGSHNHELEQNVLNRQKINNSVKRKAEQDVNQRPSKLIHAEINTQKEVLNNLTTRDMRYISKNINHARLKIFPTLPKSIEDLHDFLEQRHIETIKNEPFLCINDRRENIVMFSCKSNLEFMCHQETLYMDGTFEYCPKFFMQFFTIHAFANNMYVPVVFCLLTNKWKLTYKKLFELLKKQCSDLGFNLNPRNITIDFEMGIHSSVKDVFPDVNIVGCRFHLAQSWWRKIQSEGLTQEYKNPSSEIGNWLRHTFGLTFLAPEEVCDSFVEDFMSDKPIDNRVDNFADYLLETYIDQNATFPPEIWAANTANIYRTTNACESFHSKFKANCSSPHPNINIFLDTLKNIQTDTYIKLNSIKKNLNRVIRKDVIRKQEFINSKIEQYKNNNISRYSFVKCCSYKFSGITLSN